MTPELSAKVRAQLIEALEDIGVEEPRDHKWVLGCVLPLLAAVRAEGAEALGILQELHEGGHLVCLRAFIPVIDGRCGECVNCRAASVARSVPVEDGKGGNDE